MSVTTSFQQFLLKRWRCISFISATCMTFLILAGCANKEQKLTKEKETTEDSLQTVSSIVSEDSSMIFENNAGSWIYKVLPNFNNNWKRFHIKEFWVEDTFQQISYEPAPGFYKDYATFLRWSPDSNYILDIGTYGAVITKDKNNQLKSESGEADTEIALLYPKSKMKSRLMFFGPGTVIVDGQWLNNSQVAMFGLYDEKGDHHPDTLLWIIDANEKFFRKYKWE